MIGNLARQAVHTIGAGNHTDSRFRQPESRMFGGNNDIAGHRNFKPAAQGKTIDGRNEWFETIVSKGNSAEPPFDVGGFPGDGLAAVFCLVF
jgi:hypothetical protein